MLREKPAADFFDLSIRPCGYYELVVELSEEKSFAPLHRQLVSPPDPQGLPPGRFRLWQSAAAHMGFPDPFKEGANEEALLEIYRRLHDDIRSELGEFSQRELNP